MKKLLFISAFLSILLDLAPIPAPVGCSACDRHDDDEEVIQQDTLTINHHHQTQGSAKCLSCSAES